MEKNKIWSFCLLVVFLGTDQLLAQEGKTQKLDGREAKVQKHTLMEQFEPDLVVSFEDRIKLKRARIAELRRMRKIIDTLAISNRKRQKLIRDLRLNPFSTRVTKAIADNQFEEIER